jgi:hypothetical protein
MASKLATVRVRKRRILSIVAPPSAAARRIIETHLGGEADQSDQAGAGPCSPQKAHVHNSNVDPSEGAAP